uniref:Uncharacterized protein n=1 Tax=Panagrolaimus sp. PS1159 TaxID=55785 RepID=A0AC35FHD5_9BILA
MAADTPSSSTTASKTPPSAEKKPTLKKKGKKKKLKIKPVIPKSLTANLGETQKKERESEPEEIFEKVSKPKPKTSPTKSSDESSSTSASSNSAESTTKTISIQSLPKLPPRQSKCLHDEKKDKIVEYKIDVGRTYSQSSGTLSYDSINVADEAKVNTYRAMGVVVKPVDLKAQPSKVIDLNAQKHIEQTTSFDDEKFQKLVYADECPANASPTPEYLFGRREQQLTKEAIMLIVDEYFSMPRDDMDLTIRVQRHGTFPILDTTISPNPRIINSALSTSSHASSTSEYSTSSSATSVDPEGCLRG